MKIQHLSVNKSRGTGCLRVAEVVICADELLSYLFQLLDFCFHARRFQNNAT